MIDRYKTKEMEKIWSDHNKYNTWLKVEIAVTEVLSEMGKVPTESLNIIKSLHAKDLSIELKARTNYIDGINLELTRNNTKALKQYNNASKLYSDLKNYIN